MEKNMEIIDKLEVIKNLSNDELNEMFLSSVFFKILELEDIKKIVFIHIIRYSIIRNLTIYEVILKEIIDISLINKTLKDGDIYDSIINQDDYNQFKKLYLDFRDYQKEILENNKNLLLETMMKHIDLSWTKNIVY